MEVRIFLFGILLSLGSDERVCSNSPPVPAVPIPKFSPTPPPPVPHPTVASPTPPPPPIPSPSPSPSPHNPIKWIINIFPPLLHPTPPPPPPPPPTPTPSGIVGTITTQPTTTANDDVRFVSIAKENTKSGKKLFVFDRRDLKIASDKGTEVKVLPKTGELLLVDGVLTVYLDDALEFVGKSHKEVAVSGPSWQPDNQILVFTGPNSITVAADKLNTKPGIGNHFRYDKKDFIFLGDTLRMTSYH